METGDYKISYTAYSDAWTGSGNVGKSSTREYSMTVSDLVAPVFKSVEDWRIPETWGKTVYKRGEDGKEEATQLGNKIHFTVPEVVDNDPESPVTVYFRITDSDNSKTVIEFTNILADDNEFGELCRSYNWLMCKGWPASGIRVRTICATIPLTTAITRIFPKTFSTTSVRSGSWRSTPTVRSACRPIIRSFRR